MGKVAVVEAVAENKVNGCGNGLNSPPLCGASTVGKRTMPVTNAGRNKLTRGRPALQPRNKEKILAKEKARATEKGKARAMEKGKGNGEKGGKGKSGKGQPSQTTPRASTIPLPEPAEGEEGPSNPRGSSSFKGILPTWPNPVDLLDD